MKKLISNSPFGNLKYKETILEIYGLDLTDLYESDDNKLFLLEWITLENNKDIYIIYEIDKKKLNDYLNYKITHLELIKLAENNLYYKFNFIDMVFLKLNFDELPQDTLPKPNVYYCY